MDVKLGTGLATGMFYHAPAGTALPTDPTTAIDTTVWTHVGDVTNDGITLTMDKSAENLRNWANVIKRVIMTEHTETIQAPLMDTTEEVLKAVLGEDNVTTAGGVTTVNLSAASLPEEEAFLFVMKDGEDMMMIGCTNGQVTEVDDVTFAPESAINWVPTITAMGDGFKLIMK